MSTEIGQLLEALQQVEGAYSLVLMTKGHMYAVRDPNGFRPLVLGMRISSSFPLHHHLPQTVLSIRLPATIR